MEKLLIALLTLFLSVSAPAATLNLAPASQMVNLGDTVTLEVVIDGLTEGAAPSLGAYDLAVTFDPAILDFLYVSFGDPVLGSQLDFIGGASIAESETSLGAVRLFEVSLESEADLNALQAASFVVATITFSTSNAGSTALGLQVNAASDAAGGALPVITAGATVDVLAVPEPSVVSLLAVGLCVCSLLQAARRLGRDRIG